MYREPELKPVHALALVVVALFMAWPPMALLELSGPAAVEALAGRELAASGSTLPIRLLGQPTEMAPVAPWLLATVGQFVDGDWGVRACGLVVTILLALVTGFAAGSRMERTAGIISIAAVLTCVAGIRMPVGVVGEIAFALLINAAWYVWYEFGRERKSWLFAWSLAYLLVGLALLTGGVKALLYFYWPLLFVRRPMRVWLRLRQWDHWVGFLALAGFAALWTLLLPTGAAGITAQLQALVPDAAVSGYLRRLVTIPLVAAIGFFPWVFLVWPAFCGAYRQLEPRPVFCSYLRTICISLFVLIWFVPIGGSESLLALLGPLAVLVSRNYAIMVRRHGRQLQYLCRLLAVVAIGGAGAALLLVAMFWGGVGEALVGRGLPRPALLVMLTISVPGLLLAVGLYRSKAERPVWAAVALAMAAVHFTLFAAIGVPTASHFTAGYYRNAAARLRAAMPEEAVVYWLPPNNRDPRLGWYLSRPVIAVNNAELPPDQSSIYVLAGHRAPVSAQWQWRPASEALELGRHRLRMWHGIIPRKPAPPAER